MRWLPTRRPVSPLFVCAAALSLAGCSVNPATGERQLILVSEAQEASMGREYDPQIIATMGLYADQALQTYVQNLGARLAAASERPNLTWTFRVVDDPVVNAFALPGGYIYVTRGILAHFGSEAELAGVLGHEIGHVTARHSVSQMSRQQLAQIGLVVGVVAKPDLAQYAEAASAGLGILFLKYGRDDERQADDLGLRYLLGGNFDPRELPSVFTMLERVSAASGGGRTPEWLSTHPNPEGRRERIEQQIAALRQNFGGTVTNRDAYVRRLDGLVYGANPREGFFRENEFFHPDFRFRLTFPAGWKTANQKQAVIAVSPAQDAMIQLTGAKHQSVSEAAQAFYADAGVSGGPAFGTRVNGLEGALGEFVATTENATLAGSVLFVSHAGTVFQIIAYSNAAIWRQYEYAAERTLRSVQPLTDRSALAVQPLRLSIVALAAPMTIETFAARYPSQVSAETLALLNRVSPGQMLPAGRLMKRVVGGPLPD